MIQSGCQEEVTAELRRRSSVCWDTSPAGELSRQAAAPRLSESLWCLCCFYLLQDLIKPRATFSQAMLSELDSAILPARRMQCGNPQVSDGLYFRLSVADTLALASLTLLLPAGVRLLPVCEPP